jgi:hypothetical protein
VSPQGWRNRIVGHGEEAPDQLLANPRNWRVHPKGQQDALAGVLEEVGWVQDVIVNRTTGHVVDGHARIAISISKGEPSVPVVYVELTPDEEAKVLATFDPLGAMAGADRAQLEDLLQEVRTDDAALRSALRDLADDNGFVFGGEGGPHQAPEAEPDRAEELRAKWGTREGQLWEIGRHRLLCGDATKAEDVERLMGDETPGMVFADPPYGVSIVATNGYVGGGEAYDIPFGGKKAPIRGAFSGPPMGGRVRGAVGASNAVTVGKYLPVKGDETTETATTVYRLLAEKWPRAVHVWWGGNYYADALPPSSCWLVWNKENGRNAFADCELAWTNQKSAVRMFTHRWNGMLRDSERERRWHPTQKPAALAAWCFEQYAPEKCAVLDPFAGAGWSVIAAEQTGRSGYGLEYEADYVAVTLERLAKMGLEPRLSER